MPEGDESFQFSLDKPVEEGQKYTVEVIGEGKEGDGVAKVNNFVVFIPGANEGEEVTIEIDEVRARSAVGKIVEE